MNYMKRPRQVASTLVRYCSVPKLTYWLQDVAPELTSHAALRQNAAVRGAAADLLDLEDTEEQHETVQTLMHVRAKVNGLGL